MIKKFIIGFLSLSILFNPFFGTSADAATKSGKEAFFYDLSSGKIIGIHPDRARQMYVWKSASTIDAPEHKINGNTIRSEINAAYKSWEDLPGSFIRVASETTDWSSSTLRFYAMDFEVDTNGYVSEVKGKGKYPGVVAPISNGKLCEQEGTGTETGRHYVECATDRFDYVKIYINVAKMLRDKKINSAYWSDDDIKGTIAHEIGHALGFVHQDANTDGKNGKGSIMIQTNYRDRIYGPTDLDRRNANFRFPDLIA